ncbi:WG repeat-containing protein, partial [Candidatus Microgenomates bacterium]|nr:WG repeat-containing protein [Candidatus Microgenomates bacterium]
MDSSGFSLEQTPQSGSISSPKEPAGPPPTAELTEDDPYEIKRRMEIAERHGFDYVGGFQDVGIARAQKGLEHYLVDRTGNRVMDLKGGCPSREIVDGIVLIQGGEMVNSKDYLKTHFAIDSGLDTEDDLQFIIDGDYYYFNVRTGKIVGYQSYEVASDFSEGFARVKGDDEKYKFITTEGRNAFPVGKFEPVGDFSQGVAPVRTRDGKVIFIDKNGHQAVSGIYDYALTFKEGFANVKKDGERMFVNKDGEDIFRDVVDWGTVDIMSDFYEGISVIVEKEGNVFFLTTTGEKITPEIPTSRRDQDIIWLIGS